MLSSRCRNECGSRARQYPQSSQMPSLLERQMMVLQALIHGNSASRGSGLRRSCTSRGHSHSSPPDHIFLPSLCLPSVDPLPTLLAGKGGKHNYFSESMYGSQTTDEKKIILPPGSAFTPRFYTLTSEPGAFKCLFETTPYFRYH